MQGERQDVDFPVAEKNDVIKMITSFSVTPTKGQCAYEQFYPRMVQERLFSMKGKSQIGVVLSRLFGCNMKDGSIGKISENRFARADLEHTLLCVDDDMRMEALRQTNYVKSIVTAQGQMDLERKGKQS